MAKPTQELSSLAYKHVIGQFYIALSKIIQDPHQAQDFLHELLTPSEIKMIHRRWHVACELDEGKTIRDAAAQAKVGTDTAMRVSKRLGSGKSLLKEALELRENSKGE